MEDIKVNEIKDEDIIELNSFLEDIEFSNVTLENVKSNSFVLTDFQD